MRSRYQCVFVFSKASNLATVLVFKEQFFPLSGAIANKLFLALTLGEMRVVMSNIKDL